MSIYLLLPLSETRQSLTRLLNDKTWKPVGKQIHIDQRPVFSVGNECGAGHIDMCKCCQGNSYSSFQMIVNHMDSTREYYFLEKDSASLKAAALNKWPVISM